MFVKFPSRRTWTAADLAVAVPDWWITTHRIRSRGHVVNLWQVRLRLTRSFQFTTLGPTLMARCSILAKDVDPFVSSGTWPDDLWVRAGDARCRDRREEGVHADSERRTE